MANRKQRRQGKPQGVTYAEVLARKKYQREVCEKAAYDTTLQIQSEIRTQRALWLSVVAMSRAFGIGPKRFQDYAKELLKVTEWYQEMLDNTDEVYANEKLRREASKCSGIDVGPLYDKEMYEATKKWKNTKEGDADG
jgi:hypothetical protein